MSLIRWISVAVVVVAASAVGYSAAGIFLPILIKPGVGQHQAPVRSATATATVNAPAPRPDPNRTLSFEPPSSTTPATIIARPAAAPVPIRSVDSTPPPAAATVAAAAPSPAPGTISVPDPTLPPPAQIAPPPPAAPQRLDTAAALEFSATPAQVPAAPAMAALAAGPAPDWQVTTLADGRLYAKVPVRSGGRADFASFGLACARSGGLKVALESGNGTMHPQIRIGTENGPPRTERLQNNEIVGVAAADFVRWLIQAESSGRGTRLTVATGSGQSSFDAAGWSRMVARLDQNCGQRQFVADLPAPATVASAPRTIVQAGPAAPAAATQVLQAPIPAPRPASRLGTSPAAIPGAAVPLAVATAPAASCGPGDTAKCECRIGRITQLVKRPEEVSIVLASLEGRTGDANRLFADLVVGGEDRWALQERVRTARGSAADC